MKKYFTWLDIRRKIREKTRNGHSLPDGIVRINCYSEVVEIGIKEENKREFAQQTLKEWFGNWFEVDKSVLKLDIGNSDLPVEINVEEPFYEQNQKDFRPFWQEMTYASNFSENQLELIEESFINLPEPYNNVEKIPQIVSFYSFKGGVGRTLHLVAFVLALVEEANKIHKPLKILVIDSDLEAPGITYWQRLEQKASISFLDFLEIYHYSPVSEDESLSFLKQEIHKNVKQEKNCKIYTLPACIEDQELLDISILPEHLVKNIDDSWRFTNALYKLGFALDIDYIFVDLRSGLSEISSPILFDPRVQRFLVTTLNDQSINGTSLVLKQLSYAVPSSEKIKENIYYDPVVLMSFLTPPIKLIPNFQEALIKLQFSYLISQVSQEMSDSETRLKIKETDFSQNLLYVNNWNDARIKLADTTIMKTAREWAKNEPLIINSILTESSSQNLNDLEIVRQLRDICQKYIYAESGEANDLLITESLKNLALKFQTDLPHVVSMGAKGSGKTFNYIQLSRLKCWHKFLQKVLGETIDINHEKTYIYPLLQSSSITGDGLDILASAKTKIAEKMQNNYVNFSYQDCKDRIETALNSHNWNKLDWTQFWLKEIADSIGFQQEDNQKYHVNKIDQFLKEKDLKIIFLFDGIEDIFTKISTDEMQKIAVKSLIEIPQRLAEIRYPYIGLIIFIRRDFISHIVEQNLGQFEALYRDFAISWDSNYFLKLVYWIFLQSKIPNLKDVQINTLGKEELIKELGKVWGNKLGLENSSESFTTQWIFAVLSDFKGRLQARDIVRFLYYTAHKTYENQEDVEFEKWSSSINPNSVNANNRRLLPPKAIRYAIEPCSKDKIREAKEEYPDFAKWCEDLPTDSNNLRIPFDTEQLEILNIDKKRLGMLDEMGVIYEDKDKENNIRYYIPEIFRNGLKFILDGGARPRVVTLKRKISGKDIL